MFYLFWFNSDISCSIKLKCKHVPEKLHFPTERKVFTVDDFNVVIMVVSKFFFFLFLLTFATKFHFA